jgi:hypothetical protein
MHVIGVFADMTQAEDAIRELESTGIARGDISLVVKERPAEDTAAGTTKDRTAGVSAGAALGGVAGLLLGLAAFSLPGVGLVVAAGPIAAALAAGGVGALAGGVMGALTGLDIPKSEAAYYADQVRHGSALLMVRAADQVTADNAREVLDRAGARPPEPLSGARMYDVDGLEFDPPRSSFEDFGKS